jgi:hypothetical protein
MFYKNYLELIVFKYEPASFENQIYFQIEFWLTSKKEGTLFFDMSCANFQGLLCVALLKFIFRTNVTT